MRGGTNLYWPLGHFRNRLGKGLNQSSTSNIKALGPVASDKKLLQLLYM